MRASPFPLLLPSPLPDCRRDRLRPSTILAFFLGLTLAWPGVLHAQDEDFDDMMGGFDDEFDV